MRSATRADRNHVTELIAEQALVVLHVLGKPEGPERTSPVDQEVLDTPSNQDSNDVIVERPPRLVACRHGVFDQAHLVIDERRCHRNRVPVVIASHRENYVRAGETRVYMFQPVLKVGLGQRAPLAAQDGDDVFVGATTVAHHLALDTGGGGSSEVRPQRLAPAAAQVRGMVFWKEQHSAAEPLPGG